MQTESAPPQSDSWSAHVHVLDRQSRPCYSSNHRHCNLVVSQIGVPPVQPGNAPSLTKYSARAESVRTLLSFAIQLAAFLFVPAIGSGSVRDVCERARGVTSQFPQESLSRPQFVCRITPPTLS